jgi:hypothetical protein
MASNATKMANEPEDTRSEPQPDGEIQDVLFSELAPSVCYWTTIFLLAVAGAYLIRWWLIHPGSYVGQVNDPWGITTPPWLILPLPPIGVIASLGHAAWCAFRGQRTWKMLVTSAGLIAVMGRSKLLENYLAPM